VKVHSLAAENRCGFLEMWFLMCKAMMTVSTCERTQQVQWCTELVQCLLPHTDCMMQPQNKLCHALLSSWVAGQTVCCCATACTLQCTAAVFSKASIAMVAIVCVIAVNAEERSTPLASCTIFGRCCSLHCWQPLLHHGQPLA
jgi:hypothetical protein